MDFPSIKRGRLKTLQVNLGYKCNQSCLHCHVNASPFRTEMMNPKNISLIPKVINSYSIETLDITGGAPEMHPLFKDLVNEACKLGVKIIDRCNLTILDEPGYQDLPEYLAKAKVAIIASLPCYEEENVNKQRGKDVFRKSINVLKILNKLGYGKKDGILSLDLVYNPIGAFLPPPQESLEKEYKYILKERYGIEFNNLLVLANMPINRFSNYLQKKGKLNSYQSMLERNHNSGNLESVMCKSTLSVDWQGNLFDCDFNQQLGASSNLFPRTLRDLSQGNVLMQGKEITVDSHCFGCTAGNGSSCGGSLT